MAFFAKCFCYNRRSWKEGSWIAERWGPFERSVTQQREKSEARQTDSNSQLQSVDHSLLLSPSHIFYIWKKQKPQKTKMSSVGITVWSYGMYPKLVWMTENWNCLFLHTSSHPLTLHSVQPRPPTPLKGVISDQRPVGREDVDLCVRRKWVQTPSPAFSPNLFLLNRSVSPIRPDLQWLPSLQQTIHWINIKRRNRLVAATLQWGNCSCFYLSGKCCLK